MVYILKQKTPRNKSKDKKYRLEETVKCVDLTVPTKSNFHCIQRKPLSVVKILKPE